MQKIIKKNEKGITLMMLVFTIIILTLISVPTIVNLAQVNNVKRYSWYKADMDSLTEVVQLAYGNSEDISTIGPTFLGNTDNIDSKNDNDNSTYYLISLDTLNSKLSNETRISLNFGELNKNYTGNAEYNSTTNEFGTESNAAYDAYIINQKTRTIYYSKGIKYNGKTYYRLTDQLEYFTTGPVNPPKISEGMIPIKYSSNTWVICNSADSEWYNYYNDMSNNGRKWANVMLSDGRYKIKNGSIVDSKNSNSVVTAGQTIAESDLGSMFVWIPRFAYKIDYGVGTTTASIIEIEFLKGTSDYDFIGNKAGREYTVSGETMENFVVHPAFRDGTAEHFANGEWDNEITGFWIAKFPAGYQASTINSTGTLQNGSDTIVRSNINYTGTNNGYVVNPVDTIINTNTKMSYPVFKPLTYAYNCIRAGDSYNLARDIQNASFYGLNNVDSHMEKNSEWGAVAYLTSSNYGRRTYELNVNNYNMNNTNSKNTYSVTGLYANGTSVSEVTSISAVNAYNTSIGKNGSNTGNITGVYDLSGCIWEYEANYITNGSSSLSSYASQFAYTIENSTPQANGKSTKWATAYPYDSSNDAENNNWIKYSSLKSATYGFGDAILETSTGGEGELSWHVNYSYFPFTTYPIFMRGGDYSNGKGIFSYFYTQGKSTTNCGFRVVLIP